MAEILKFPEKNKSEWKEFSLEEKISWLKLMVRSLKLGVDIISNAVEDIEKEFKDGG